MDTLIASLTRLAAAFPRDNASKATLAVYVEELSGLDQEILRGVLNNFVSHGTNFPTLGEIRSAYRGVKERTKPPTEELPLGRVPMPEHIRKQINETFQRFDERAEELNT